MIFETTESVEFEFLKGRFTGEDGKTYTITVSWQADKGHVFADDGTKIEAYKAVGDIKVVMKDSEGRVVGTGGQVEVGQVFGQDGSTYSNQHDCHGATFASGQVWINDQQVER